MAPTNQICPIRLRADVLIDSDNVSANRQGVVECIVQHAKRDGFTLQNIQIVGKSETVLANYANAFSSSCPNAQLTTAHAWAAKNSADILAAIWFGQLSCELRNYEGEYRLYVLSYDKLVTSLDFHGKEFN